MYVCLKFDPTVIAVDSPGKRMGHCSMKYDELPVCQIVRKQPYVHQRYSDN